MLKTLKKTSPLISVVAYHPSSVYELTFSASIENYYNESITLMYSLPFKGNGQLSKPCMNSVRELPNLKQIHFLYRG